MIENNVKILTSKDYNVFIKYVEEKYGKRFMLQFKHMKHKS